MVNDLLRTKPRSGDSLTKLRSNDYNVAKQRLQCCEATTNEPQRGEIYEIQIYRFHLI